MTKQQITALGLGLASVIALTGLSLFVQVNMLLILVAGGFYTYALWKYSHKHMHLVVLGLLTWITTESFFIQYIPTDWVLALRFLPEYTAYFLLGMALVRHFIMNKGNYIKTPIDTPLYAFVVVGVISMLLNTAFIPGVLGMRQLLRFFALYYALIYSHISWQHVKVMLYGIGGLALTQAGLGLVQYLSGGAIDHILNNPYNTNLGVNIIIEGTEQFWVTGQRIFATMGRYDKLGSFLAVIASMLVAILYDYKLNAKGRWFVTGSLALVLVAIVLTYSRASWIATAIGIGTISVIMKRDRRVILAGLVGAAVLTMSIMYYLAQNKLNIHAVQDLPEASIIERIIEPFSAESLRGSYEGFGRYYFIVNTPTVVVPEAPLLGHGPGQYGSGVAAALNNKAVYNELGMPFGVFGEIGQIDNNWFSIWGEYGTIGVLIYLAIFLSVLKHAYTEYFQTQSKVVKTLHLIVIGSVMGVLVQGFFAPYFEMRTLMYLVWILASMSILAGQQRIMTNTK